MNILKKTFLAVILTFLLFFISNGLVYAALIIPVAPSTGCYCCGGSQSCTYTWKEKGEAVGSNCSASPQTSKTQETCNGTSGSSSSSAGACWYCDTFSRTYYTWTDDGASPNTTFCKLASGMGESACYGTPEDHENAGVGETSNEDYYEDEATTGPKINFNTSDASCSGILGNGDFKKYLGDILNIIRILGVALVIVFSTMDFGKALIAQDNDALKKSSQTALKRLFIAIIIFFTPVVLNILLSLVGISGICI